MTWAPLAGAVARGFFLLSPPLVRTSAATASRASAPPNEGCLSLPNCQYWHFVEHRASSPDDRQHTMAQSAEDAIYISMCSGAMVKVNAAEQAQFILGQITVLGLAMVVTLVELAIWLANWMSLRSVLAPRLRQGRQCLRPSGRQGCNLGGWVLARGSQRIAITNRRIGAHWSWGFRPSY